MKILYLTHFFPPELNGGARRVYDLSKTWVSLGHDVTVSTGFPSHPTGIVPPEYKGQWISEENMDGIKVLRTKKFNTPNKGFFLRILNHLSMAISAFIINLIRNNKYDVLICTSPPLFIGISAVLLKKIKKIPFVFELRDLWPQQAIDLGILKNKLLISLSKKMERFFYKQADHIIVVTKGSIELLVQDGVDRSKITLIRNGVLPDIFRTKSSKNNDDLNINNKFVISYLGTFGHSQGLETILLAAKELAKKNIEQIHFLLVGDGVEKEKLLNLKLKNNLNNVSFLPTQPFNKVPDFYKASDVLIIILKKNGLFKNTIPSKVYEIMASGKPILAVIEGECSEIINDAGCGFVVEPENYVKLADKIIEISKLSNITLENIGNSGKQWVFENANRVKLSEQYISTITTLIKQ